MEILEIIVKVVSGHLIEVHSLKLILLEIRMRQMGFCLKNC